MIEFHHTRLSSLLAGVAATVFASAAFGQGATITGTVKSSQGQVLHAANVRIANLNISVGTDADGVYRISLPPDRVRGQSVTLSVRAVGYRPQNRQIIVGAGLHDHDFTLEFDVNRVSEVVVTDARTDTVRTSARGEKQLAFTVDRATGTVSFPSSSDFSQHLFPPELIMQHQSRLKLTEQQRDAIVAEINKVQATATQAQWRVAEESEKLTQLVARDVIVESSALEQVDRLIGFETEVKRAQLSMLIRVRNVLTPEQRSILSELRRRR